MRCWSGLLCVALAVCLACAPSEESETGEEQQQASAAEARPSAGAPPPTAAPRGGGGGGRVGGGGGSASSLLSAGTSRLDRDRIDPLSAWCRQQSRIFGQYDPRCVRGEEERPRSSP